MKATKREIYVGVAILAAAAAGNTAFNLVRSAADSNTWDYEVKPLQDSIISLSKDRKRDVITQNQEKYIILDAKEPTPERAALKKFYSDNVEVAQRELDRLEETGEL